MAAKKKPKKKRSLADRYRSQIETEGQLRFAPQKRALRDAVGAIAEQLAGDVAAAQGAARGVKTSARAALPRAERFSREAGASVDSAQTTLAGKLPGALGTTPALSAASARDAEGTKRRLAESLADTRTELTARETDAEAGAAYAASNARATASREGGKIRQKLADVASDEGAFKQGRLGELTETARGRGVTRRGQDKSAATQRRGQDKTAASQGETRDADYLKKFGLTYDDFRSKSPGQRRALIKRANKGKDGTGPGGEKPASRSERNAANGGIQLGYRQAKRLKVAGRSRQDAVTLLVEGREAQTIKNNAKGEALPNPVKVPGVKKVDELHATAAVEVAYDGYVSKATAKRLHARGLTLKDLRLPRSPKRKKQYTPGSKTPVA